MASREADPFPIGHPNGRIEPAENFSPAQEEV